MAKEVFELVFKEDIDPDKYVEEKGNYYPGIPYRNGNAYVDEYINGLLQ